MLTAKELKKILHYDKNTGLFTRKIAQARCVKVGDIAGYKTSNGYIEIKINNVAYKAHRLAWLYITGKYPKHTIDHKNHNRSDNRFKNLRDVAHQENCKNLSKSKNNTSGVNGVYWKKSTKRWFATIKLDDKQKHLGYFTNFSEAVDARKNAEVLYGYYENHGA